MLKNYSFELKRVIIGINMVLDKQEQCAIELDNNLSRDETDEKFIYSIQAAKDKIMKQTKDQQDVLCFFNLRSPA